MFCKEAKFYFQENSRITVKYGIFDFIDNDSSQHSRFYTIASKNLKNLLTRRSQRMQRKNGIMGNCRTVIPGCESIRFLE